jgi:ATP-dependent Clp protease adaptor protein ClpS
MQGARKGGEVERSHVVAQTNVVVGRLRARIALTARRLFAGRAAAPGAGAGEPAHREILAAREPRRGGEGPGSGAAVITRTRTQAKRPNMYRVLLLNDDYTPMEFVIMVLQAYFNKDSEEATRIMLHVHHHGVGECGVFTYEVAETKVAQVMDHARKNQHPLQCIMEKK